MKRMTIAELDEFVLFWAPAILRRATAERDTWTIGFVQSISRAYYKRRNWMPSPKQERVMRDLVAKMRRAASGRQPELTPDEPLIEAEDEGEEAA